ncbi:MAG: dienelactone hydrolase family protein [Acidobacteria bacterium]|nr:dienelactone hydrolase family protein [Acidobacteriota bacterium]MCB9397079.1 dienelactone hydrolase family protein [Acidobacteriota bacterium]
MKILPMILISTSLWAGIQGGNVDYKAGETVMKGYLVYDDAFTGKRPCVLVVHEWWGHNAYARSRADQLAKMGYLALAVDMYGEGKTADHPETAGQFAGAVMSNFPEAKSRFEAALNLLKSHPMADADHTAAIGYCFGGGVVLEMAKSGVDLDAVASFHGSLTQINHPKPNTIQTEILVCNGADDKFIPQEAIDGFKKEMESAGIKFQFINYPGAVHSFTNPDANQFGEKFGLPLAYNKEADEASWKAMSEMLKRVFAQ